MAEVGCVVEICVGVAGKGYTSKVLNREDDPYCIKRFCISLYLAVRVYELLLLYSMLVSGEMEFCPDFTNHTSTNVTVINTTTANGVDDNVKKFTKVAKYITFYSVIFEVALGYLTFLCFLIRFSCCTSGTSCAFAWGGIARTRWMLCCFHSESYIDTFSKAITPFLMCDAILFLTVAPIGNVHPFLVTCTIGYISAGLRLASYVLTFVLLLGFRYHKHNNFQLKAFVSLVLDFVGLFLALFSVSSSLATLISLGIPEMQQIRYSYATATFINVIITYVKYYTTIDIIRVETTNTKTKRKEICFEVMNHTTFWIKLLFGDIVLITLNLIIWTQHYEEDIRYAGLSLISTTASTIVGISKYVFASSFCQHDPLYKWILAKLKKACCCCGKEKSPSY